MKPGTIVYKGKIKNGQNIIIRYIKPSDLKQALDYINQLSTEKTFIIYQGEKISLEEEKKYIADKVKNIKANKCVHLFGFINDILVASSDIDQKRLCQAHVGSFGITVAKKYRGLGIGKLIASLVIEEAKKMMAGLKIITLEVFSDNQIAISLYHRLGFRKYGSLPKGVKHQNHSDDDILMYKSI